MAIEIDSARLKWAKYNAGVYEVEDRIEFINANFFTQPRLFADVVFLSPSQIRTEPGQKLNAREHFSPNIKGLLKHALDISKSVCLQLPAAVSPEDIAEIFSELHSEAPEYYIAPQSVVNNPIQPFRKYFQYNYVLQMELIYVDETYDSLIVYFGDISQVKRSHKQF